PQRQKQIAALSQSLAEHAGQPQKLYYDHIDRGDLLVKNKDFAHAAQDFETARALATTDLNRQNARLRLAKALAAGGRDAEALDMLGIAITAGRSADPEGYHERARLNGKLRKTDAALADFGATIALDPENLPLRFERFGTLMEAGRLGAGSAAL